MEDFHEGTQRCPPPPPPQAPLQPVLLAQCDNNNNDENQQLPLVRALVDEAVAQLNALNADAMMQDPQQPVVPQQPQPLQPLQPLQAYQMPIPPPPPPITPIDVATTALYMERKIGRPSTFEGALLEHLRSRVTLLFQSYHSVSEEQVAHEALDVILQSNLSDNEKMRKFTASKVTLMR